MCVQFGMDPAKAAILITTPQGWKPPPGFPRRDLVQVKADGTRVGYVNALRVLRWCGSNL